MSVLNVYYRICVNNSIDSVEKYILIIAKTNDIRFSNLLGTVRCKCNNYKHLN